MTAPFRIKAMISESPIAPAVATRPVVPPCNAFGPLLVGIGYCCRSNLNWPLAALGFDNLDQYIKESPHFGAIIGRYGRRSFSSTEDEKHTHEIVGRSKTFKTCLVSRYIINFAINVSHPAFDQTSDTAKND